MPAGRRVAILVVTAASPQEPAVDQPIPCPQCGAPARITDRFSLGSTDGPVEHLKTGCVNNHWLTPPAETLAGARPDPIPAAAQLASA
jgi:hypothetical protein